MEENIKKEDVLTIFKEEIIKDLKNIKTDEYIKMEEDSENITMEFNIKIRTIYCKEELKRLKTLLNIFREINPILKEDNLSMDEEFNILIEELKFQFESGIKFSSYDFRGKLREFIIKYNGTKEILNIINNNKYKNPILYTVLEEETTNFIKHTYDRINIYGID